MTATACWRTPCLAEWKVTHQRSRLGAIGENLACRELERLGYAVVARRYRRRGGEIDIIARDGETTVFVEVKTRGGSAYGSGADAVTTCKRRRMVGVALEYLARRHAVDRPCRFDVVAVHFGAAEPRIEVFRNAFTTTE